MCACVYVYACVFFRMHLIIYFFVHIFQLFLDVWEQMETLTQLTQLDMSYRVRYVKTSVQIYDAYSTMDLRWS